MLSLAYCCCVVQAFMPPSTTFSPLSKLPIATTTPRSTRTRTNAVQMNLADRFFRVVKANLNSVLQNLEDPEKILEQAVEDMQRDLIKIRQSYAEVSATQKRMERQKEQADNLSNEWYKRAQLALGKGDEELAREALGRRQQQVEVATSLGEQMSVQASAIDKLFMSMQQLEAKITEAKAKKDQMIARARTAKTSQKVNDMLSSVTGSTSMDAFERMKEKVEMLESKAEVAGQLAGVSDSSLEGKFKLLGDGDALDEELRKMKGMLGQGEKKTAGFLPAGEAAAEVDLELEALRKDLGK
jgi:phage shock protein A